jgi:hypothetical protein
MSITQKVTGFRSKTATKEPIKLLKGGAVVKRSVLNLIFNER